MARTLPLLDAAQRREFDQPPKLNLAQRQLFFALPDWASQFLQNLLAPHSRGGFVLQAGYFKATGRFFSAERFWAADRLYVQQLYQLGAVDWERYDRVTRAHHRQQILHHFGVTPFEEAQAEVLAQLTHFARHQMNPVAVFRTAADYLRSHRLEVPTYAALAGLVTTAFRTVKQQLTTGLARHLTPALRQQLDALFTTAEEAPAERHRPYRLTLLKRTLELMRPAAIRTNVQDYALLHRLFEQLEPLVRALDLSDAVLHYYARYVERAQVFQVQQQADKKYLMLICFLVYQYHHVSDLLTETLLQAVQTHRNAARRETKERVFRHQQDTATHLRQVLDGVVAHSEALDVLEQTAFSFAQTNEEKVTALLAWLQTPSVIAFKGLRRAAQQLRQAGASPTGTYYQVVEERSRTLQSRLGELLRQVRYEGAADNGVAQALAQYQARAGQLGTALPEGFLKAAERAALDQAESRVSLYKALLAGHVADQVKAGKLNLPHSLSYRPFEEYLLDAATWARDRQALLDQTNLTPLREVGPWLDALQEKLAAAFARTFGRLADGTNPDVRQRADGRPRFVTPARSREEPVPEVRALFPEPGLISLYEVLHTVNAQCRFTDSLEHWNPRHRPRTGYSSLA